MFQMTKEEFEILKSQIATSSSDWGGKRKPLLVFTEHGAVVGLYLATSVSPVKIRDLADLEALDEKKCLIF